MTEQDRIPTEGPAPAQAFSPSTPAAADFASGPAGTPPASAPDAVPQNGYAPQGAAPGPPSARGALGGIFPPGTNDFAILSLVIAVGGMATGMGMATSPVSIVLGFMGLSRIKRTGERGREMAIAGILIGFVMILVSVLLVISMFVYMFVSLDMYGAFSSRRY